MTESPNSINPAEDLYDLAALHCVLLPARGTDRFRALAAARDCIQISRWFPEYGELADEFLVLAEALPTADAAEEHLAAQEREVAEQPPPPQRERKPRRRSITKKMIEQAEKATGKTVTSITTPDGTTLHFGEPEPTEATNPWLADLDKVKQQ
jgi:hypothetical protein